MHCVRVSSSLFFFISLLWENIIQCCACQTHIIPCWLNEQKASILKNSKDSRINILDIQSGKHKMMILKNQRIRSMTPDRRISWKHLKPNVFWKEALRTRLSAYSVFRWIFDWPRLVPVYVGGSICARRPRRNLLLLDNFVFLNEKWWWVNLSQNIGFLVDVSLSSASRRRKWSTILFPRAQKAPSPRLDGWGQNW